MFETLQKHKQLILGFIIGAFSYLTATSLNTTLQKVFNEYIEEPGNNIKANVLYTTTVLLVSVFTIVYLSEYMSK